MASKTVKLQRPVRATVCSHSSSEDKAAGYFCLSNVRGCNASPPIRKITYTAGNETGLLRASRIILKAAQ
jgi:hypothetical protein